MTALYQFTSKTMPQIRSDILRTISNGLRAQAAANGVSNFSPNVGEGSDYYIIATALATELAVIHANSVIASDNNNPLTASGSYLDQWLTLMGLQREPAAPSYGYALCPCSVTSTVITAGTQCIDPSTNNLFQVQTTNSYGSTTPIPLIAVNGGASTNLPHGYVLQWVTTPPYMSTQLTVGATSGGTDGLAHGADSEVGNDGPPRARLLQLFQQPQTPGNSSQVISWLQQSSPLVQSGAVYPALLGPSSVFFAAWGAAQTTGTLSSTSKNRSLQSTLVSSTLLPYVAGLYESGVFVCGVSTFDLPCDVAIQLTLPSAPNASPPGPGGGWLDGVPWPPSNSGAPVKVTAVSGGGTTITVNASTTNTPTANVTRIAFIDPTTWTLNAATVTGVSGSSGAWVLTLSTPFPNVAVGNYIFPQSTNQANYLSAILQAFASLGAGEWSSSTSVSFRRPTPTTAYNYNLDASFLRAIENAGQEVLSAAFLYRQYTTPPTPATPVVTVATNSTTGSLTSSSASGTFTVANGSASVTTSVSQVGTLFAGSLVTFAGYSTSYVVASVTSGGITLTDTFGGSSGTTTATYTSGQPSILVPRNIAFYQV